jgi:predicted porin
VFDVHMWRTKANYQFTRALSLRAIVDYNLVAPNAALVTLDRDKRFTLDILATYLVNPGTALYVGVTDAYANLRLDPTVSPLVQRTDNLMTSTGRQFFVKMSYLLRF